jgi:HD superfamily phosphohydrolase YqeK
VNKLFEKIKNVRDLSEDFPPIYVHLLHVADVCVFLAEKRGLDADTSYKIGLLHDIASLYFHVKIITEITKDNHAILGADIVMEILSELNETTAEENEIICRAVKRHNYVVNDGEDTEMDILIKDADAFSHWLGGNIRGKRWISTCGELGLDINMNDDEKREFSDSISNRTV